MPITTRLAKFHLFWGIGRVEAKTIIHEALHMPMDYSILHPIPRAFRIVYFPGLTELVVESAVGPRESNFVEEGTAMVTPI